MSNDLLSVPSSGNTSGSSGHHHHSHHSNSSGLPSCVSLEPATGFDIEALTGVDQSLQLRITNTTQQIVAFKVKTTSPTRYLVKYVNIKPLPVSSSIDPMFGVVVHDRPAQDIIPVGESRVCHIVVTRFATLPDPSDPKAGRDKFSVQNMRIDGDIAPSSSEALAKLWKDVERLQSSTPPRLMYNSTRLRCRLVIPKQQTQQQVPSSSQLQQVPHVPPKPPKPVLTSNGASGGKDPSAGFMSSSSSAFFNTTAGSTSSYSSGPISSARRERVSDYDMILHSLINQLNASHDLMY
jgi:hypothetical protein